MPKQFLINIAWHTLTGPHTPFSSGTRTARRYTRGFSPIIAFADPTQPDFPALSPYCEVGEHFYCGGWSGTVPGGWQIEADSSAHQLIWEGSTPALDDALGAVRLTPTHVPQMLKLVEITQPGPFAERTLELGEYYGVFEGDRLVAMAGERFEAGTLREISAVCTHPDYQGRGLARRLVQHLIRRERERNQTPFLHVMHGNDRARRMYERLGFYHVQELAVRVVSRLD